MHECETTPQEVPTGGWLMTNSAGDPSFREQPPDRHRADPDPDPDRNRTAAPRPTPGRPSPTGHHGVGRRREGLIEVGRVDTRVVEWIPSPPVRQRELSGNPNVLFGNLISASPRSVRHRCPRQNQIGAHPVDVEGRA